MCILKKSKVFIYFILETFHLKKKENIINVKLCILLSHASKGHNLILMISNIQSYLKLYYDVIYVMLLSDDVTYQFVLYCVVSKHLLLALSVLCLFGN